jgi:hypothetical protein
MALSTCGLTGAGHIGIVFDQYVDDVCPPRPDGKVQGFGSSDISARDVILAGENTGRPYSQKPLARNRIRVHSSTFLG